MTYHIFDTHAAEYDAWYDNEPGKSIYALEVECLRPLLYGYPHPYLEIGVGAICKSPGLNSRSLGHQSALNMKVGEMLHFMGYIKP